MIRDAGQHSSKQSVLRFNPGEGVTSERPDHRMTGSEMLEHVIKVRDAVAELTSADGPVREMGSDALRATYRGGRLREEWNVPGTGGAATGEPAEHAKELAARIGREMSLKFQLLTEDQKDQDSLTALVGSMAGLHNAYQALSESGAAEIREATGGAQDSQTIRNMLQQADGAGVISGESWKRIQGTPRHWYSWGSRKTVWRV